MRCLGKAEKAKMHKNEELGIEKATTPENVILDSELSLQWDLGCGWEDLREK